MRLALSRKDDSVEMLAEEFGDHAHVARCEHFNLSRSRNAGLAHPRGYVGAFTDDDSALDRKLHLRSTV